LKNNNTNTFKLVQTAHVTYIIAT